MTEAQGRALTQLLAGPVLDAGRSHAAYVALVRAGLATYLPAPGFEITDAGRAAHAEYLVQVEATAARHLGNANEEREKRNTMLASRWDRAAQRAHDLANDLRGQGS